MKKLILSTDYILCGNISELQSFMNLLNGVTSPHILLLLHFLLFLTVMDPCLDFTS